MAVVLDIVLHDQRLHLYLTRLKGSVETACNSRMRNTVVADQGIREDQNLAPIRRIRERLYVACHPGIEYYFAGHVAGRAECMPVED